LLLIINFFSLLSTKKYSFDFKGVNREYLLHLPFGYKPSNNYPLLVVLHGFGDHPRLIEQYSGFSRKADKEKFIVAYPYGSQNKKTQKFSWNGGSCCGEAFNKKIDDVLFINSLVDKLIKQYNIDSKRVYLTGFSNGALLTYKIAAEAPEKFSAFAIVSGSIGGKIKASDPYYYLRLPKKAVPILIMHGQKDALIPYLGGLNPEKNCNFYFIRRIDRLLD
jgi:polyhydroxybutyrate depolymerase